MLIAGNWKMHKGPGETAAFCAGLLEALGEVGDVEVVVAPTFVSVHAAVEELQDSGIRVYAQNVHWAEEGAYTGEVSRSMLIASGVAGAIVGHSERRQYFGETDETVGRRAEAALDAGLWVIACIGELEEDRERGHRDRHRLAQPGSAGERPRRDAGRLRGRRAGPP